MKTKLLYLCIACLCWTSLSAQWTKVHEVDNTNYYNIHTSSPQEFYALAGNAQVHHSTNAGMEVMVTDLQPYGFLQSMDFLTPQIGYIGGGCYFTFNECPANSLFKTTDGGASWEVLQARSDETGVLIDISVIDEQRLYTLSDYGGLEYSADGGLTWTDITIDTIEANTYIGMKFFDQQTGIVGAQYYFSPTDRKERYFKTTDGGASWEMIYEGDHWNTGGFQFLSPQIGFIVNNFGKYLSTKDGGSSWTEASFGDDEQVGTGLFFVDENNGYISSYNNFETQGRIYRTTNGGNSWSIDFEINSNSVRALHFSDADNGFAILGFRQIYQRSRSNSTTNTPQTLTLDLFPNPTSDYLNIVNYFPNSHDYRFQINDITGQLLQQAELPAARSSIDMRHLPKGVYTFTVFDASGELKIAKKVILQ